MKKTFLIIAALVLLVSFKSQAFPRSAGINFGFFYSSLQPYGEWIAVDNDLYAFRPNVYRTWEPYSDGRWVWTANGWYWDSYEPFGWATFHYGRWYHDDFYGWMWLPDYEWGPSWVEWRYDDDYIGWAPLPPYALFNVNVGIHYNYDWHFPYHHWHYVNFHHFNDYNVNNYFIADKYKYRIHSRTKYRDNYDYRDGRVINRGVDKDFVERRSGARIPEREVVETSRLRNNNGGRERNNNRVEVYRPGKDELERTRNIEKFDIKKPERKIALDVSKVESRTVVRNRDAEKQAGKEDNNRIIGPNDRKYQREVEKAPERKQVQRTENKNTQRVERAETPRVQKNETPRVQRNETPRVQKNESPRVQRNETPRVQRNETPRVERKRNESNNDSGTRSSGNQSKNRSSGGERRR